MGGVNEENVVETENKKEQIVSFSAFVTDKVLAVKVESI